MIGYQLATIQPGNTTLHRVRATPPAWTLCGVWATTYPKVSAQASPTFCEACFQSEAEITGGAAAPREVSAEEEMAYFDQLERRGEL